MKKFLAVKFTAAKSAFLAAITSPTVVTAEKSVAVLIVTRVLLAVGAGTGAVELAAKIINSL